MSSRDDRVVSEEDFDIEELYTEKSEEEKARMAETIHATVIFHNITDSQRELIYKVMETMEVKAGQAIVKQQGMMGGRFYIVDYGSFEKRVFGRRSRGPRRQGGRRCSCLRRIP
jgi:hypothetical protein